MAEPAELGHRRRRAWQLVQALDTLGADPATTLALAERMATRPEWLAVVCEKADQLADAQASPFPRFADRPPSPATVAMVATMLHSRVRADATYHRRTHGNFQLAAADPFASFPTYP